MARRSRPVRPSGVAPPIARDMGQSDRQSRRRCAPSPKLKTARAPSQRRRQAEPSQISSIPSDLSPPGNSPFRQLDGSAGRPSTKLSPLLVFLFLSYPPFGLHGGAQGGRPCQALLSGREFPASLHPDRSSPRNLRPFALLCQHESGELR